MRLRDIPVSELESLTLDQLSEKYGFTAKSISRYRAKLGFPKTHRKGPAPKHVPEDIAARWCELYERDRLTIEAIRERFPGWSRGRIAAVIRERRGGDLERGRWHSAGWCTT